MIKVFTGSRVKDVILAQLLHGEDHRRIFVNFKIPGITRKVRSGSMKGWYEVIRSKAILAE